MAYKRLWSHADYYYLGFLTSLICIILSHVVNDFYLIACIKGSDFVVLVSTLFTASLQSHDSLSLQHTLQSPIFLISYFHLYKHVLHQILDLSTLLWVHQQCIPASSAPVERVFNCLDAKRIILFSNFNVFFFSIC